MAAFWAFALYYVVGFVPTFWENILYTVYYMKKKCKKTAMNYTTPTAKPSKLYNDCFGFVS
jgi:hypothetical protein